MLKQNDINNYKNALVEVEAVLNCLDYDAYQKIPQNVLDTIEENQNKDYEFNYNEDLDYDKWNLSVEAKALLYNIYKDYIANKEERKYFKDKEEFERYQNEKEKSLKYDSNSIFENTKQQKIKNDINKECKELIKVEEKWYVKIFNKIKNIFKVN